MSSPPSAHEADTSSAAEAALSALIEGLRSHWVQARGALRAAEQRAERLRVELGAVEAQRESAAAELERIEALLRQADRLGDEHVELGLDAEAAIGSVPRTDSDPGLTTVSAPGGRELLSGARLREASLRAALRRGETGVSIHHAQWLTWLREDGYEPAGKKPEAVFLTQLSRSPLVKRTGEAGYYHVDLEAPRKLQQALVDMHERLQELPPPGQMSILGGTHNDARLRRQELEAEIARTERQAEEAWRTLALERPPGFTGDDDDEIVVRAWLNEP